ncbi:hypothetical protein PGO_134100 [Plasmodium gonderi]|uniref:Uncharacterized protein n=1 Tax=Plasmodium gonderi TaxID=77519 RepID=A0A1Y1JNL4_PLAGO|nr:hypothetical protein PGO_134100 [Plasmodium gonderi]GAW83138.1 hypothetical protein PGO_134100 [Plasmodium gonderi]
MVNCVIPRLRRACCFPNENCFLNLKCNSTKKSNRNSNNLRQYDALSMDHRLCHKWGNYLRGITPLLTNSVEIKRRGKLKTFHQRKSKVSSGAKGGIGVHKGRRSRSICVGTCCTGGANKDTSNEVAKRAVNVEVNGELYGASDGASNIDQMGLFKNGRKTCGNFINEGGIRNIIQIDTQGEGTERMRISSSSKESNEFQNQQHDGEKKSSSKLCVKKGRDVENYKSRNLFVVKNLNSKRCILKSGREMDMKQVCVKKNSLYNKENNEMHLESHNAQDSYTQCRDKEHEACIRQINLNISKKNVLKKVMHLKNEKERIDQGSPKNRKAQEEVNYDFLINTKIIKEPNVEINKSSKELSNNLLLRGNIYRIRNGSKTSKLKQKIKKYEMGNAKMSRKQIRNCKAMKKKTPTRREHECSEYFSKDSPKQSLQKDMYYRHSSQESSIYEISIIGEMDLNFNSSPDNTYDKSLTNDFRSTPRSDNSMKGFKKYLEPGKVLIKKGAVDIKNRNCMKYVYLSGFKHNTMMGTKNTSEKNNVISSVKRIPLRRSDNTGDTFGSEPIGGFTHKIVKRKKESTNDVDCCEKNYENIQSVGNCVKTEVSKLDLIERNWGSAMEFLPAAQGRSSVGKRKSSVREGKSRVRERKDNVEERKGSVRERKHFVWVRNSEHGMQNSRVGEKWGSCLEEKLNQKGNEKESSKSKGESNTMVNEGEELLDGRSKSKKKQNNIDNKEESTDRSTKRWEKESILGKKDKRKKKKKSFLGTSDNVTHSTYLHEASSKNSVRGSTITNKCRSSDLSRDLFAGELGEYSSGYDKKKCSLILEDLLELIKKKKMEMTEFYLNCDEFNKKNFNKHLNEIKLENGDKRVTKNYRVNIAGSSYEKEKRMKMYNQFYHIGSESEDARSTKHRSGTNAKENKEKLSFEFDFPSTYQHGPNSSSSRKFIIKELKKKHSPCVSKREKVKKKDKPNECSLEREEMKEEMIALNELINLKIEQNEKLKMCLIMKESEINLLRKKAQESYEGKNKEKERNWENTTFYKNLQKAKPSTFLEIILKNNKDIKKGVESNKTYERNDQGEIDSSKFYNGYLCGKCKTPKVDENNSLHLNDLNQNVLSNDSTNIPMCDDNINELSNMESNFKSEQKVYSQNHKLHGVSTGGICSYACCVPNNNFTNLVIEDEKTEELQSSQQNVVYLSSEKQPKRNNTSRRNKTKDPNRSSTCAITTGNISNTSTTTSSTHKKCRIPMSKAIREKKLVKINGKAKFQTYTKICNEQNTAISELKVPFEMEEKLGIPKYSQLNSKGYKRPDLWYSKEKFKKNKNNNDKLDSRDRFKSSTISVRCLSKNNKVITNSYGSKNCFFSSKNSNKTKNENNNPKKENIFSKLFSYIRNNSLCNEKKNNNCLRRNKSTSSIVFVKNRDFSNRCCNRSWSSVCLVDHNLNSSEKINYINNKPCVSNMNVFNKICGGSGKIPASVKRDHNKSVDVISEHGINLWDNKISTTGRSERSNSNKMNNVQLNNTHDRMCNSNGDLMDNHIEKGWNNKTGIEKGIIKSNCRYVLKGYNDITSMSHSIRDDSKNKQEVENVKNLGTREINPCLANTLKLEIEKNQNICMVNEKHRGKGHHMTNNETEIIGNTNEKVKLKSECMKKGATYTGAVYTIAKAKEDEKKKKKKNISSKRFSKLNTSRERKTNEREGRTKLDTEMTSSKIIRGYPTKERNNIMKEKKVIDKRVSDRKENKCFDYNNTERDKIEIDFKKVDNSSYYTNKLCENNTSEKSNKIYKIFLAKKENNDKCSVRREQFTDIRKRNDEDPQEQTENSLDYSEGENKNKICHDKKKNFISADKCIDYASITSSGSVQTNTIDGYSTCSSEDMYLWGEKKKKKMRGNDLLHSEDIKVCKLNKKTVGDFNVNMVNSSGELNSSAENVIQKIIMNYKKDKMNGGKRNSASRCTSCSSSDTDMQNGKLSGKQIGSPDEEMGRKWSEDDRVPNMYNCKKKKKKNSYSELNGDGDKVKIIRLKGEDDAYTTTLTRMRKSEGLNADKYENSGKIKSQNVNNILYSNSQSSYPDPKIFFLKNDESCVIVEYPNVKYYVKCS